MNRSTKAGLALLRTLDQQSGVELLALGDQRSDSGDTHGLPDDTTEIEQGRRRRSLFRCRVARGVKHGGYKKQSLAETDNDHGQTKVVGLPSGRELARKEGSNGKQHQTERQGHARVTA